MRKLLMILIPVLLVSVLSFQAPHLYEVSVGDTLRVITPEPYHGTESRVIAGILGQHHYRHMSLNDSLSSAIFDQYLKSLDYNKLYLIQADIDGFEVHREKLDDYVTGGNLEPVYEMYNAFEQRFFERLQSIDQLLDQEFDFTVDEYYETEREDIPWANSIEELDEEWRKLIKSQVLSLVLTDKTQEEAIGIIKKRYQRYHNALNKYNSEDVFQTFMNAVCQSYDPHTNYFSPASADNFNIQMSRSLEGIGARLYTQDDYTVVSEVVAGGPAFKSKLIEKDDKIIGVAQEKDGDMQDVIGWRIDDVVKLIRGPKGSTVRLMILSAKDGANALPHEIKLVREKINLEDQRASSKVHNIEKNGQTYSFGVIDIPAFYMDFDAYRAGDKNYNSTTRDVKRIIGELEAQGVDGIMIDLRRNGGGALNEAIELSGLFIKSGPVVQVKDYKGEIEVDKDPDPNQVYDGPLVVLTSHLSASASEIFSGAIQDYKRGIVVGDNTYGKGTVQNIIPLNQWFPQDQQDKAGQLKMTLAKYYRVTGESTQSKGVVPDVALPSIFDYDKIGESSEPSALPWDKIESARFEPLNEVSEDMIAYLNRKFEDYASSDEKIKELLAEIAEIRDRQSNTQISLNEAKRRSENEKDADELSVSIDNSEIQEEQKEEIEDPYIYSAVQLLADLFLYQKQK